MRHEAMYDTEVGPKPPHESRMWGWRWTGVIWRCFPLETWALDCHWGEGFSGAELVRVLIVHLPAIGQMHPAARRLLVLNLGEIYRAVAPRIAVLRPQVLVLPQ